MDRTLVEWERLAHSLLSPSRKLESTTSRPILDPHQALALLSSLETITRQALPKMATPTEPAPKLAPEPPKPDNVKYGSSKQEYQKALQDRQVIEALLEYNKKAGHQARSASAPSTFSQPEFPIVEAQPKTTLFRRGVAVPILRTRK